MWKATEVQPGTAESLLDSMREKEFLQLIAEADPSVMLGLRPNVFHGAHSLRNAD
jgi:hypothetical protein